MESEEFTPVVGLDARLLPELAPCTGEGRFAGWHATLGDLPGVAVEGVSVLADQHDPIVAVEDDHADRDIGEVDDAVDPGAAVRSVDLIVPDRDPRVRVLDLARSSPPRPDVDRRLVSLVVHHRIVARHERWCGPTARGAHQAAIPVRSHVTCLYTLAMLRISRKAESFTESVIREMNRLAVAAGAVSLAQGFPDFACPPELKAAVTDAVAADHNQYAITFGAKPLRDAIAAKTARFQPGWTVDPDTQITVVNGATEGMIAAMLGLLDPGDEVIVFEPFYENYGPDAILTGAIPRYVTLHEPDWQIDPDELRAALTARTRAIVVNSPHNPTGKVFSRRELDLVADLCREHDLIAFTDDIYQHLVYEGEHIPLATLPGMAERTVSIDSMSKTYSVTGWRVGWVIASPELTVGVRRVHDFLTVGAAAPLQQAAVAGLTMADAYYAALLAGYRERRDVLLPALEAAGFRVHRPAGAYYAMTDIRDLTDDDDVSFARRLIADPGVATVPGSSFYSRPELGRTKLRFAFPKRLETLRAAAARLATVRVVA